MPYEIPDPNDPSALAEQQGAAPVARGEGLPDDVSAMIEKFQGDEVSRRVILELGQLRPLIEQAAEEERSTAMADVGSSSFATRLPDVGGGLRNAWQKFDAAAHMIATNPNLSDQGREDALAEAEALRDAEVQHIALVSLSDQGDQLLARFPEPSMMPPPPEVSAEGSLRVATFPHVTAGQFATDAVATLRRASDAAGEGRARARADWLLSLCYGPLTERRVTAPERHARALREANAELARLIGLHLDTTLGAAHHRVAVDLVARARREFTFAAGTVRQNGHWPEGDVVFIGAPSIAPTA